MTLICEIDLGILKMYLSTKNEVSTSTEHEQDIHTERHTDRQMRPSAVLQPHSQVVEGDRVDVYEREIHLLCFNKF